MKDTVHKHLLFISKVHGSQIIFKANKLLNNKQDAFIRNEMRRVEIQINKR